MSESTGTNAVSRKPAKAKKSDADKLAAMTAKHKDVCILLDDAMDHIRHLEAQKDIAERKAVSDSHDTKRNANALILIETYLEDAAEDDEKTVPVSRLSRVSKQLTKEFTAAALQIQAH